MSNPIAVTFTVTGPPIYVTFPKYVTLGQGSGVTAYTSQWWLNPDDGKYYKVTMVAASGAGGAQFAIDQTPYDSPQ